MESRLRTYEIGSILLLIDDKDTRKGCEGMVYPTVNIFDEVDLLSITNPLLARLISLSSHEIALRLAQLVPTAISRLSNRNFLVQNGAIS